MSALAFELPTALEAREPPAERDGVKLLVADRAGGELAHHVFRELPQLLHPGDVVVVNASATVPAAVAARRADGAPARVHFSTRVPGLDASWRVVELRTPDGSAPARACSGETLTLRGGATLELMAPYLSEGRLMLARIDAPVERYLELYGEPIRYGYVQRAWPLSEYQNVYATTPGSAEMPSAGRPFTPELITRLVARGVAVAPITLHCGVSSPERHEPPFPEYFEVPDATARLLAARTGRVIAVGTTVVRALETTGGAAGSGWTSLIVTAATELGAVDGLITGWHEPDASHLQLLEAVAGASLLRRSYEAALERGYRWHEFGDSHLIV
ncbi:MAG TPA: S-adenosylmethionine:tRNA ribosyltransferase-isomerase [Solirubrobacteraceae bacterium]|jgi:S-adenosylmethionine:tRNA ribosyltransferase-isomerase|nr:S-adenosylmethionine:tRNA ribosyltransferase-isomerase [Solirubrobacteraceae bacterium]